MKQKQQKVSTLNESLSVHDHYLVKKEVAKLIAKETGVAFREAFDSIEDETITSRNPKEIFESLKTSPKIK